MRNTIIKNWLENKSGDMIREREKSNKNNKSNNTLRIWNTENFKMEIKGEKY